MAKSEDTPPATLDERRIVNALEANIIESDTIQGSEISEQRQRNHVNYALDRLGNEKKGRSDYQSADVLDAVESQKAFYLEAFASGRQVINFMPESDEDTDSGKATKYVEHQFWDLNSGYCVLRDALHDAFVAKKCVIKVDWLPEYAGIKKEFSGATAGQVAQIREKASVTNIRAGTQGVGSFDGTIESEEDHSRVDLLLIQPERFFRDPNASYIKESSYAGYQDDLSRYEMVDEGYDEDEVMALNLDYRFRQNEEDAARKAHDSTWSRARRHKRTKEQEVVTVYHSYAYMDLSSFLDEGPDDTNIGATRLYHFVWSQGQLLTLPGTGEKWEEVDEYPFLEWTQYKISHSEYGLCDADLQGSIQWNKSNLVRLIIDNQAMTNTSRWKARSGFIKNPRELLDNNIGSVLWVKNMKDSLEPLPTAPLSPVSFNVLEVMDTEKENRNGMSRLAKGMSGDAVSHQNADQMIERLTNASNRRVLRGVRDFAESFLKPLYLRIYKLGVENDKRMHSVEMQGKMEKIQPEQMMKERSVVNVQVATAPDQGREWAKFMLQFHQLMSADPELKMIYGLPQKAALLDDVMDLMGLPENYKYLAPLDSPQVQKQLQSMQQQQQQAKEQQQQMQQMSEKMAKMQMQLDQSDDKRKWAEANVKKGKLVLDTADTEADNLRADAELQLDRERAAAEYQIEKDQQRGAEI